MPGFAERLSTLIRQELMLCRNELDVASMMLALSREAQKMAERVHRQKKARSSCGPHHAAPPTIPDPVTTDDNTASLHGRDSGVTGIPAGFVRNFHR